MLPRSLTNCTSFASRFRASLLNKLDKRQLETAAESVKTTPNFSVSQCKVILQSNDIAFTNGYTCLVVPDCPLPCRDKKKDKRFYICKSTGHCVCQSCGRSESWNWLEERLTNLSEKSSIPLPPVTSQIADEANSVVAKCQPVAVTSPADLKTCLTTLNLSHVPARKLAELGACVDLHGPLLLLPLRGGPEDSIGAWKALRPPPKGSTRPIEEIIGLSLPAVKNSPLLLAHAAAWSSSDVVLVPSAADFLALAAHNIPAICLAAGSAHLPSEALPSLEPFSRLTLWFHSNLTAARNFMHKLGTDRCYIVRPDQTVQGAHEEAAVARSKKPRFTSLIEEAHPVAHPAIASFAALREEVRSDITREDVCRGVPWLRFPRLTKILGGFRGGELTVLTGATGVGKTTFLSEYSLDLCMQGVNTLWGNFEIRNSRLARTLLTQMVGEPLSSNMDKFEQGADRMEALPMYFMVFHGQQPLQKVMEVVSHAAYIHNLGHVIIDNLQFMMGLTDNHTNIDKYLHQDRIIAAFRQFATTYNCHVTMVIHPRKEPAGELLTMSSVYGSAKATQEADNVLLLQTQNIQSTFKNRKFLQVAKNRYTGEVGSMPLHFDRNSLSFTRFNNSTVFLTDDHSAQVNTPGNRVTPPSSSRTKVINQACAEQVFNRDIPDVFLAQLAKK